MIYYNAEVCFRVEGNVHFPKKNYNLDGSPNDITVTDFAVHVDNDPHSYEVTHILPSVLIAELKEKLVTTKWNEKNQH